MNNFVSPIVQPESPMSGSTVKSLVNQAKELGLDYFAMADQGTLIAGLKTYMACQEAKIKPILGVQLYIEPPEGLDVKYVTLAFHARTQDAYQFLVKLVSENRSKKVKVGEIEHNLYSYKDIEKIAAQDITVTTTDIESMVTKALLVNKPNIVVAMYDKLNDLFKDRFYPALIAYPYEKYWDAFINISLGGTTVRVPVDSALVTDRYHNVKASELITRKYHKQIKKIYINGVGFKIKPEHQNFESAEMVNVFSDVPGGDLNSKANLMLYALAQKHGNLDKLLINSHAFYSTAGDKVVQDMKLGTDLRFHHTQHMRSSEDILEYFKGLGFHEHTVNDLVQNNDKWAKSFENFELKYDYRLPDPGTDSPETKLVEIIKQVGRMKWDDPRYTEQFKEEFKLLTKNGIVNLIPYFLPIVEVYDFYEKNGHLTGPARGSAGGFLISYLCGITHIDPIQYELSTSRFLTLDRVKQGNLPDIDCDLESRVPLVGKDGNSGYLFDKYGDKAAQVSTRTLLRVKSAILDANRFMNGSVEDDVSLMCKSLPNTPPNTNDYQFVMGYEDQDGNHIDGLIDTNKDLKEYAEARPAEWDVVLRALSLARQNSRHACAYVVADTDIKDIIPIMEVGGVTRVTQPVAGECEWAGLIKYDFLVVKQLQDIKLAINYINKKEKAVGLKTGHFMHKGKDTYIWDLVEEPDVFNMLSRGETESMFQLHSKTATPIVMDVRPESVVDCAVITSLGRPGPLDFIDPNTGRNMPSEYAARKRGESKSSLPILDEMLPETYGVLVFQEQVTKLAKELAGMGVEDAENVRIAVGKKKKHLIDSLKPIFIEGAAKKVGQETATIVWDMMETFARYGFNKSHAVAYSVITYACAYLKHHYNLEWWAAVLSNAPDKEINELYFKYVKDLLLPPDINTSSETMTIDYRTNKIRNKLSIISGLGNSTVDRIIEGRPYKNITDFVDKKVCGPSMAKKLIRVQVLDSLFDADVPLTEKFYAYDQAVSKNKFDIKLAEYDERIDKAKTDKEVEKQTKLKDRYEAKGPKPVEFNPNAGVSPKEDFLIKKTIFPTMSVDLISVLRRDSDMMINTVNKNGVNQDIVTRFSDRQAKNFEYPILPPQVMKNIDENEISRDMYFAIPGYVIEAKEFPYKNNTKKAFKALIDCSGYVTEKVKWPDYETGELNYPKTLKKGTITWFFMKKKANSPYTNIVDMVVES